MLAVFSFVRGIFDFFLKLHPGFVANIFVAAKVSQLNLMAKERGLKLTPEALILTDLWRRLGIFA